MLTHNLYPSHYGFSYSNHYDSTHPVIAARINTLESDKGPGDVKFAMGNIRAFGFYHVLTLSRLGQEAIKAGRTLSEGGDRKIEPVRLQSLEHVSD